MECGLPGMIAWLGTSRSVLGRTAVCLNATPAEVSHHDEHLDALPNHTEFSKVVHAVTG